MSKRPTSPPAQATSPPQRSAVISAKESPLDSRSEALPAHSEPKPPRSLSPRPSGEKRQEAQAAQPPAPALPERSAPEAEAERREAEAEAELRRGQERALAADASEIVKLNVGGTRYFTTRVPLCPRHCVSAGVG